MSKKAMNPDCTVEEAPATHKKGLLRRFRQEKDGVTAIEFAILALPFLLLVFAIFESCLAFAGQQLLQDATDDVVRKLRTGQLKTEDVADPAVLKAKICERIQILVDSGCTGLVIDLRQFSSFEDAARATTPYSVDPGTGDRDIDDTGFTSSLGGASTKNMLRVYYKWPVITDLMRSRMSNLKDGKTLLYATTTWQNEPFN